MGQPLPKLGKSRVSKSCSGLARSGRLEPESHSSSIMTQLSQDNAVARTLTLTLVLDCDNDRL